MSEDTVETKKTVNVRKCYEFINVYIALYGLCYP